MTQAALIWYHHRSITNFLIYFS